MSFINKFVLDTINSYKTFLEQNINSLINCNTNSSYFNLFTTGEYKLFSIITENVRIDLNYLLSLNPDYDILVFPALKRNIRISIEAYYDLFNLVIDRSYMELLEYQSGKINHISEDIINKYQPYLNRNKKKFTLNTRPLTISEKANIAKNKNNLNLQIYTHCKGMATASNAYIHPNIFVDTNVDRDNVLKLLIFCDCQLIMYSFELINTFLKNSKVLYISTINPYDEYNKLYNSIAYIPWICTF